MSTSFETIPPVDGQHGPGPFPPGMPPLTTIVGAFLIASWLRSWLCMAEFQQALIYFSNGPTSTSKNDSYLLKGSMALVVLLNTMNMFAIFYSIFDAVMALIAGQPKLIMFPPVIILDLTASLTTVVQIIVQGYLTWRLLILTRSWILTGVITFICLCGVVGNFAAIGLLDADNSNAAGPVMFGVGLCFGAVGDLLITGGLVFKLRTMYSPFKETDNTIHRIIMTAIRTGCTSSAIAVTIVIVFLIGNRSTVGPAISLLLGPSFSLSMLINLNLRGEIRSERAAATAMMSNNPNNTQHSYYSTGGTRYPVGQVHVGMGQIAKGAEVIQPDGSTVILPPRTTSQKSREFMV